MSVKKSFIGSLRRFICLLSALVMTLSLCGCGTAQEETDIMTRAEQPLCAAETSDVLLDGVKDSAEAAVVYCPDNSQVICGHNIHDKRPIASITKIMTALLCLEYAENDNKAVRITRDMYAEGSSMYLKEGEIISMKELVKGMMAVSGNDAANAAAVAAAGSIRDFASLMNRRAQQLGMRNTHFTTPSGLDEGEHYSSAYDMALLCAYAMRNKDFRSIVSEKTLTARYIYPAGKVQRLYNHNKLLSMCSGCMGIKTGYTKKAGRTLTSCAERSGIRLIIVTLCDSNDWNDHCTLYDSCFSRLKKVRLCGSDMQIRVPLAGGREKEIALVPEKELYIVTEGNNKKLPEPVIYAPGFIYAPAVRGRKYGKIEFATDGKAAVSCALVPLQKKE